MQTQNRITESKPTDKQFHLSTLTEDNPADTLSRCDGVLAFVQCATSSLDSEGISTQEQWGPVPGHTMRQG